MNDDVIRQALPVNAYDLCIKATHRHITSYRKMLCIPYLITSNENSIDAMHRMLPTNPILAKASIQCIHL